MAAAADPQADGDAGRRSSRAIGVLTSRIGRRFVLLFLGCAFVPLLAFAWLGMTEVAERVQRETDRTLRAAAKSAGMNLAAKFSLVASDCELTRSFLRDRPGGIAARELVWLQEHLADRFSAMWIVEGGHDRELLGDAGGVPTTLDEAERDLLHAGRVLLRPVAATRTVFALSTLQPDTPEQSLLVGRLRGSWLFDAQELQAPSTEIAIFDHDTEALFHSFADLPDTEALRVAADAQPASGLFSWSTADGAHTAYYWHLFLRPRYGTDFLIAVSMPHREAEAAARGFEQWFTITALCALLCVLAVSLVQIRRTLDPIVQLHAATQRVAAGDLGTRIAVIGTDEFGELARSFNYMTDQIVGNLRQREAVERELVEARDKALVGLRLKDEFVTNVSHELRTPMAGILSAVEILEELGAGDPEICREFAALAANGARHLAKLIDDVLELDSTAPWHLEPVLVQETLRDAVLGLPAFARPRVRLEVADGLPHVNAAAPQLVQTWHRLLDNAVKFSPPETPIDLRARAANGQVVVEVQDRGEGIAEQDLPQLFTPFVQVGRNQMTNKAAGTGLGLTLVAKVIGRLGGRIEVESQVDKGSTFGVWLPAVQPTPPPAAAAAAAATQPPCAEAPIPPESHQARLRQ